VRACIVGGGLAGSLLAWRLALAEPGRSIDVVTGTAPDASAASGGAVRAYEEDPEQRRLATAGMVELLGSRVLREWAGFVRADSVYLRRSAAGLAAAAAEVEQLLPGSVELLDAAGLARLGWADVHAGGTGVHERLAGYCSPDRLRTAVLADAPITVHSGPVRSVEGTTVDGRAYDVVVLATGPWTPRLLRSWDLPAEAWRTKSIQYAVHPAGDWLPTAFVDGVTGLFGRPAAGGGVLLGLPTELWDADPDAPPVTPSLGEEAARLAAARFPRLRLGPPAPRVGAVDCYRAPGALTLRRVLPGVPLFSFSGGSGGSAKTALAASARAALQLADPGSLPAPHPVGREEGQR
jgi:glycine/D-amino acid oxidase-like deaminating enzyme